MNRTRIGALLALATVLGLADVLAGQTFPGHAHD